MEPLTIFAASVAFIGLFHLLSSAVNMLGKSRKVRVAKSEKTRSDWYCFFKMSDLHGMEKVPSGRRIQQSRDKRHEELIEQRRRQQANRPRLHA